MQVWRLLQPGLFSALGLLMADYRHDYIATIAAPLNSVRPEEMLDRYDQLRARTRSEMSGEGVDSSAIRFEQQVDLKYGYQMYEMTLPFPVKADSSNLIATLAQLFTDAHNQTYGYYRDDPIELMSLRLRALASAGSLSFAELASRFSTETCRPIAERGERQAFFGPAHGLLTTPLRSRFELTDPEHGPIIIEEPDTTVLVPPNWTVQRDSYANLILRFNRQNLSNPSP